MVKEKTRIRKDRITFQYENSGRLSVKADSALIEAYKIFLAGRCVDCQYNLNAKENKLLGF
jgi:hypothetical protein